MPITTEKYDQVKIDRLKHYLNSNAEKGDPKDFEIFVDSLKVVSRTNDPQEFETYEDYVNDDTERVRILIYNGPATPRNDQYIYTLRERPNQELSGLDVDTKINEKLTLERKKWETDLLKERYEKLLQDHEEAEEYIERLETEIAGFKGKKFQMGDINIGDLASVALEGIVRRNPQWIARIPGAEGLAGVIQEDNKQLSAAPTPVTETNVSFKKVSSEDAISDEDKDWLVTLKQMQSGFSQQEFQSMYQIITKLQQDKQLIPLVVELLTDNKNQKPNNLKTNSSNEEEV